MRDDDKITAVFNAFAVSYYWETDKVLRQGNRRWKFNDDGEVEKITEEK